MSLGHGNFEGTCGKWYIPYSWSHGDGADRSSVAARWEQILTRGEDEEEEETGWGLVHISV